MNIASMDSGPTIRPLGCVLSLFEWKMNCKNCLQWTYSSSSGWLASVGSQTLFGTKYDGVHGSVRKKE